MHIDRDIVGIYYLGNYFNNIFACTYKCFVNI